MMRNTIGGIIHPRNSFDLEASLRVHRMLMLRSAQSKWRFTGDWVTTGPLESLCGYPSCGSSTGDMAWCSLKIPITGGIRGMVSLVNDMIFRAMCDYPGFAALDETLSCRFVRCEHETKALERFEGGRTREPLNRVHKRARIVRNVRLDSHLSGITLRANVTLSGSSWGLFWLNKSNPPRWNERLKLATWLKRAADVLDQLVK